MSGVQREVLGVEGTRETRGGTRGSRENVTPTFQAFMNHIFVDMISEKWLKIYMDDLGIHTKDDLELHHL